MSAVAVAGGLGDMGSRITGALVERGKYEVYVMSRELPKTVVPSRSPPLTTVIETDYSSVDKLAKVLESYNIQTVICAFSLDFPAASDSQINLIRASEMASTVNRFIPSEFNVDYDLPDEVLPYPHKKFHTSARRELEKTNLEFSYIYAGMFMDYFAMPNLETSLREVCFIVDPTNGVANVPGDGESRMAMSLAQDAARYTALALELDAWPRVMTTAASCISINQLITLFEENLKHPLDITYQPIQKLTKHENELLPRNITIADSFPGGIEQVKALTADLEASIALGSFQFDKLTDHLDLVMEFRGRTEPPMVIEQLLKMAWKGK
ncbi:hypothetical protein MHUMG1_08584 [Metarhizium humberi]|uniref:NmrA-like domain-containing protein n=1 Tax=Metarhizium humberi TaxID=2596975 RepID=A0A9P8M5D2_9HYPO|nr:hypothetical protein MHUMG1_08584 [Metarhizium humberi]